MNITKEDVIHIARLARLKLTDKEIEYYTSQLDIILKYIGQLKEVDTRGIEPMSHVLSIQNVFREDKIKPSLEAGESLKNTVSKEGNLFKVPRIIEES